MVMLKIASQSQFRRARSLRGGIVIGLALALVGAGVGTATGAVTTPFQLVLVKNTATEPIPVVGTVNVGNTPANQSVTVTNFPSTQSVSVSNLPATQTVRTADVRVFIDSATWASYAYHHFVFNDTMHVTGLTLSNSSDDSIRVELVTTSGRVVLHSGSGFSRDFTAPVAATGVDVVCQNDFFDCNAYLAVFGY